MADYQPITTSDLDLPPPPDTEGPLEDQLPVSFPPPPPETIATKDKTAIRGTQLVKVESNMILSVKFQMLCSTF